MGDIPTGYTPGPWREGQDGNFRVYGPDGAGEHSGLIAVVYKGRANASLIAAAPDMAAEIARLKGEVERLTEWTELQQTDLKRGSAHIATLRAEIEKLRGALTRIDALDDRPECCGRAGSGDGNCCNQPEYGLDRAKVIARAALTAAPAAPEQEKQDG